MIHKAIKGFEDYLVTDSGRVYSLKSGKYMKASKNKDGYLEVCLRDAKGGHNKRVHRLVASAFIPNLENKLEVDHINRVRDDNRVENLRWASRKDQMQNSCMQKVVKEMQGKPIIEIINDEVSISYLSLNEVPNINHQTLSFHIAKGKTDFIVKQKNGNVRHFKVPKQK